MIIFKKLIKEYEKRKGVKVDDLSQVHKILYEISTIYEKELKENIEDEIAQLLKMDKLNHKY